jgi:carbamoyltransferase
MNVKLNQKIALLDEVKEAYFMPSCGDESNPIGAAFYLYKQKTKNNPLPFKDVFFGVKFENDDAKKFLRTYENRYKIEYYENIEEKIAKLLADFNVVARFWGRCEWGARSLGNRAILGNPSDMKTFYEINDMIKKRDFWMPFAPSILKEDADLYIKNPKKLEAPYMILGFDSTELAKVHLKAAMHQADHTLRPQLVDKETNPHYHKVISEFKKITGIGGILNTSFNLHGYPLVGNLEQALFTFENSGLKYLAIQNYLVSKNV